MEVRKLRSMSGLLLLRYLRVAFEDAKYVSMNQAGFCVVRAGECLSRGPKTLCSYRGSEGEEMVHTASALIAQQHYFHIDLGHGGVMWVLVHWCDSRRGSGHTAESDGLAPRSTTCTRPTCWILRVAECVRSRETEGGSLLCWLISRCSCL